MIHRTVIRFVNHLLEQQSGVRARLASHAGSRVRLQVPPFLDQLDMLIADTGLIGLDPSEATPDLLVTLKAASVPLLLTRDASATNGVELSGNAGLAATVQDLFARLEWDVEEDLSRVVGDVAAHRLASAGRGLLAWQRDALERTAQNLAEYLTEENPMIAGRAQGKQFRLQVQALEKDFAAAEARLAALMRRAGHSPD